MAVFSAENNRALTCTYYFIVSYDVYIDISYRIRSPFGLGDCLQNGIDFRLSKVGGVPPQPESLLSTRKVSMSTHGLLIGLRQLGLMATF